ncbi:MAG: hypothetical protein JXC32_20680 [Anaerolineae bacterium]|nr:hypothetical protein [Anaerolineae bacterium]
MSWFVDNPHAVRGRSPWRIPGLIDTKSHGTFSPTQIADLYFWGAARLETGYSDTDAVSQLTDQSGNARHMTQADAGYKPTFRTNQINSLPAIDFASDYVGFSTYHELTESTYILVWSKDVAAANDAVLIYSGVAYPYLQYSSTWYVGSDTTTVAMTAATFYLKIASHSASNGRIYRYTNSTDHGSSVTAIASLFYDKIGSSAFALNGLVAEHLIYSRELTAVEVDSLRTYFNTLYSLW